MKIYLLFLFFVTSAFSNPLQDAINKAAPHATIKLQNGTYRGNIVIYKPLTIVGVGSDVHILGDGKDSVIRVESSHVVLKNLIISNSGTDMQKIDAGVAIEKAKYCRVSNCKLYDVLYGIDMNMVENSIIENSDITVFKNDISLRGNGLKLYVSSYNTIQENNIHDTRDITLNYSHHNLFKHNRFSGNRFATHLELSNSNICQT